MTVEEIVGATVATVDMNRKNPVMNTGAYTCEGINKVETIEKKERTEDRSEDGRVVKVHERTETTTRTKGVSIGGGINNKNHKNNSSKAGNNLCR